MNSAACLEIFNRIKELPEVPVNYPGAEVEKLGSHDVIPPKIVEEEKSEWELLEEIHKNVLHRLIWIQKQFPAGSYMSIGCSNDPHRREKNYASSGVHLKRYEIKINPSKKMENLILYRSFKRINCLKVEYLLQVHLKTKLWSQHFKQFMNDQKPVKPVQTTRPDEPTYVYVQFSSVPFNFAKKD